ncbi:MAG: Endoglucanase-like protein [Acidimicrobiaceae bacterium]|nr:Endoglucanase-like protein [Acidimicrobiaceae bacterium]
MRKITNLQKRRASVVAPVRWTAAGAVLTLVIGAIGLTASPAFAVGSQSNTISASAAPAAGSTRGSYTPSATASSGDKVAITLSSSSSGCSLSSGKATFTGSGTCVVDFNDPGNSNFAAASQVTQIIKVYSSNIISTSAFPSTGSKGGSYAPGSSATSGDKVVMTLASDSSGCALNSGWVDFTGSGTCRVNFNDPGNGAFAAAGEVQRSVKVYSANTIFPSTPPAAGPINATYSPTASATSGDKVAISLNSGSTGCSLSNGKVTFTGNGVCIVEFNDVGNGAFAAASEIKQFITIGSGNPKSQGSITITSTSMSFRHALILATSGGSGAGAISYVVTSPGTALCVVSGDVLTSSRAGTCVVTAYKASDGTFAAASSLATTIIVRAPAPTVSRITTFVRPGRTMTARIIGSGFYGRPLIVSNQFGTSAVVTHDNGHVLTIRVVVARGSHPGRYRFTIVFAHGERDSIRYRLI